MFLYIYLYTVLKTDEQLFRDIFFLCQMCWSINHKGGSTVGLCFLIMSYKHPPVWLKWMTEVCVLFCVYVRVCTFVSVCMSDWDDGLYYPSATGQQRQTPTCKNKRKITASKGCCSGETRLLYSGLVWRVSSFLFIEPLFHFKEPLPI